MRTEYGLKLVLGLLMILIVPLSASASEMVDCLDCHSDADAVGEELTINAKTFGHTVHAELGCVTCHDSVTAEHPDNGATVSTAACIDCHEEVGEEYLHTTHAENASCNDCHDPHNAHGLETTSGQAMNQQCSQCHDTAGVVEMHSGWLPQADLHVAKLPCITCHTASEKYEIVLHVTQHHKTEKTGRYALAGHADLKAYSGGKKISHLIDINDDSFISLAELRTFNLNPAYKHLHLVGTLVPREASHELTTLDNRYDCSFCHASGPGSMQTSYLALPDQNGCFIRMEVEKGAVLDALYGTPDFYMTGSSRNASLNIIGLVIICSGFIMPIGHGTLRFLTRKNRKQ